MTMRILFFALFLLTTWHCHTGQGQDAVASNDFEEKLLGLYFAEDNRPESTSLQDKVQIAIREIRKSDLSDKDKFELWFYLNQFLISKDLSLIPLPKKVITKQLSNFLPDSDLDLLIRETARRHFQSQYLEELLSKFGDESNLIQLNQESLLLQEIAHYPFQNLKSLLEIGAGDGGFSVLLQLYFGIEQHYINEIDSLQLQSIAYQLSLLPPLPPSPQLLEGTASRIGLEGQQVEAVLLRNTLHHFGQAGEMLQSIQQVLLPKGKLYILEDLFVEESGYRHCEASMSYDEIISLLAIEGFRLLTDHPLGTNGRNLMVFQR
jgi:ubiquinone/menaquinone biosynthesis C-methylase UbiE